MLKKLSELVTSHPLIVVATWAAILLLGALGAYNLSSIYEPARYSDASESDSGLADTIVREEFGDSQIRMAYAFFIIYEAKAGVNVTNGSNYQNLLESTSNAILAEFNGRYLPIHYWSLAPGFDPGSFVSSDSRVTYMVLIPQNDNFEELEIEDTARVRDVVSEQIQKVGISSLNRHAVTGSPAANTDGFEVAQESLERSDVIALLMVSAVLLFVFGSILGIGIPLAALVAVLVVAFGALFFLGTADILVINEFIPNIVSMIGIGIVADYNLLLITRFREESQKGADPAKAASTSIQTAGKAVVFSGLVVMIGFGSLLILGDEFSFMMAWAVIITVAIAIISVITLTPAILTLTGHKLEWPKRLSTSIAKLKRRGAKEGQGFWARWSRTVQRHPWAFLVIGVVFILPIIAMASQLKLSMPDVSFI
ncbi:MAG: MMPL family transporter, partial [Candidatus Hodarchaeota archaeon]